jgi:hypothetical protein
MTTLVIANCFQVSIQMVHGSRTVDNVIGIFANGSPAISAVATAVKTAWEQTNGPLKTHSTVTTMVNYKVVDISSPTGPIYNLPSTTAGGVTGGIGLMSGSALITYGDGTRSRSGRGRMFHGPLPSSYANTDGRTIPTATITTLNTAYGLFLSSIASSGYAWTVLSRKNSSFANITAVSTATVIATQRRRMRS